jgi:hypothetical protein
VVCKLAVVCSMTRVYIQVGFHSHSGEPNYRHRVSKIDERERKKETRPWGSESSSFSFRFRGSCKPKVEKGLKGRWDLTVGP